MTSEELVDFSNCEIIVAVDVICTSVNTLSGSSVVVAMPA
jgi:hypothetical protein